MTRIRHLAMACWERADGDLAEAHALSVERMREAPSDGLAKMWFEVGAVLARTRRRDRDERDAALRRELHKAITAPEEPPAEPTAAGTVEVPCAGEWDGVSCGRLLTMPVDAHEWTKPRCPKCEAHHYAHRPSKVTQYNPRYPKGRGRYDDALENRRRELDRRLSNWFREQREGMSE